MHGIFTHNLLPTNRRSVCADLWSLSSMIVFCEYECEYICMLLYQQRKPLSYWTFKSSVFVWGTGEKNDFCVPLGFNDVCVCWGEVTGCPSTHSSCGGWSYEPNRRPHAVWAGPYKCWGQAHILTLIGTFYELPFVPHPSSSFSIHPSFRSRVVTYFPVILTDMRH